MKKIYVDARILESYLSGIGRFTMQLILTLSKNFDVRLLDLSNQVSDKKLEVYRYRKVGEIYKKKFNDLASLASMLLNEKKFEVCSEDFSDSICVYPFFRPNYKLFSNEVSFIHDFTPFVCSETHLKETIDFFSENIDSIMRYSDMVLTASLQTQFDASYMSEIPNHKIKVIPHGPSLCAQTHYCSKIEKANIILAVGTLEKRKNPETLFEWFTNTSVLPDSFELWWAGNLNSWASEDYILYLKNIVKHSKRKIKLLGTVTDKKLCMLYRKARFVIYPSLYEGFGFPVIDSLLHSTPVITGYNSSLQEFEQDGVFYVDSSDVSTFDEAVNNLLSSTINIDTQAIKNKYNWGNIERVLASL